MADIDIFSDEKIINRILQKEMKYENTVVLKYHIEYSEIVMDWQQNRNGIKKFNDYNLKMALQTQQKAENELYKEAIELYKYNKENGYPQMMYELYREYQITLNQENAVSMYIDEYIFSGGAHGTTTRTSQTWNLMLGKMVELYELYPNEPYFLLDILRKINREISENIEIYFADPYPLVVEYFNPDSYYIDNGKVVIYFQQYDIAPYSSGIIEFTLE